MADLWMPGATRVPGNNGLRAGAGGGKGLRFFTHHTFEAPYTYSPDGIAAMRYLHSRASTSHFVFHPVTGAIVQGLPANEAARTLAATTTPGYDVNRYGDVHMQVEVIAYARRPWTLDLTPAGRDALARLLDFLHSWGIPDQWAYPGMTSPPATYAQANAPGNRKLPTRSGHTMHSKWPVPPGVDGHWDPGAIAAPWTLAGTTRPSPAPPPRAPQWPDGWIADRQRELAALGYYTGEVDDSHGPATTDATRAYQADRGLTVDGDPGADTARALGDDMATISDVLAAIEQRPTLGQIMGYRNPGYPGRDVHGLLRDGATAATNAAVLARIEAALAESNGHEVDVAALADALAPVITEAVAAEASADVAERVVARIGALLTTTPTEEQS